MIIVRKNKYNLSIKIRIFKTLQKIFETLSVIEFWHQT